MRVVLDTNILVSAIITPGGKCDQVVTFALNGDLQPCADARLFAEYRRVLLGEELALRSQQARELLIGLEALRELVVAPPLPVRLPHASDLPFLEVARAAGAILVTGNLRHFPKRLRAGVTVMGPGELLEHLRQRA